MHWIIQKFSNESGFDDLIRVLEVMEIPHTLVHVIPFSHDLEPRPEIENPIMVIGSTTLVTIAKKYGWGPGVWFNENFTFEQWRKNWGSHLLNADSHVTRFADVGFKGTKFIRPVDDLKVFSGMVVHADNFTEWQEKVTRYNDGTVNADTLVTVADPKKIYAEYRFFVINGKVVTGSQYKLGNRVLYDANVDEELYRFAQARVDEWQPDVGFVLDIATCETGVKIIEVNNLNSAGFYHCNLGKLVEAVEAL